jgi:phosphoribosylformylglycinamidine synthase subunit PurL
LAATTDCNSFACSLDPYNGATQAIAEAVRNLACVGAEPIAVTDCLNFGSPENPTVMGQFVAAVEGMAEACRAFSTPVVSGNVSLYNETKGTAIAPTPTVGMVGLVPEIRHVPHSTWNEGDVLYLLGPLEGELGGSRFLQIALDLRAGPVPPVDYAGERRTSALVRDLVRMGLVAAHDIADGGLAVALVEMSAGKVGVTIDLSLGISHVRALFGEWQGRFLLALPVAWEGAMQQACHGLELTRLGVATGDDIVVRFADHEVIRGAVATLATMRTQGLEWLAETQA